ncbi:MAG: GNAT family N-acetyltransferase [Lachnospiraceae bacterium]|nr:GNAT family N-acetyltransferase [Lachnospiraceae bacterium]
MIFVKNYRDNDKFRSSFNELAGKTFGLNFEDWYQNRYWTHKYNPYSMIENGKVIANVSVNLCDYLWKGKRWKFIQLGTVMTDEEYRNRGLIRQLMGEIDKDYSEIVDGIFLFANDEVLDFYPKFGFQRSGEYEYVKNVMNTQECSIEKVPMKSKEQWDMLEKRINNCAAYSAFEPVGYSELFMFYITKFMQDTVYYCKEQDAYVIAEVEDSQLILHGVFAKQECDLDKVIAAFGKEINKVRLTFAPIKKEGYEVLPYRAEDCTLFIKGESFEDFMTDRVRFPELAHA